MAFEEGVAISRDSPPLDVPWRVRLPGGRAIPPERIAAVPGPLLALIVGLTMVALSLSVVWVDTTSTAAGFWPPAGASVAALAVLPARRWGWVALAVFANGLIGIALGAFGPPTGLMWGIANCAEPMAAVGLMRAAGRSTLLTRARFLAVFVMCAVVIGPLIGATIGTLGAFDEPGQRTLSAWLEWAVGDGLGVLIVTPLLLTFTQARRVAASRTAGVMRSTVVAAAASLLIIDTGSSGLEPYVMMVVLVWCGLRFGFRTCAAVGFIFAEAINVASALGRGPFAAGDPTAVPTLQLFLAIAVITSFLTAALAGELASSAEVKRLLRHQATHDALTGLGNRLLFDERLDAELRRLPVTASAIGVLLIDLDNFKRINDRFGHPTGDQVLVEVARLLDAHRRPQDVLVRMGGDEFALLCIGVSGRDEAERLGTGLLALFGRPRPIGDRLIQITASAGLALANGSQPADRTDLFRRADIALYEAKRIGDGRLSVFDSQLEALAKRKAELDDELRGALERRELRLEYQPIIDLGRDRVCNMEALLRWDSRRFGPVTPAEFIPIAEEYSLISAIGAWALRTACEQLAQWSRERPDLQMRVAVNVSARQLADRGFPDTVADVLLRTRIDPSALSLEITETAILEDVELSLEVLRDLGRLGVRLAMDDFGTGYSSIAYLRRFPGHVLKIDRSFVEGLGVAAEDTAIVESVIDLARSFGMRVVAEGVESPAQREALVALGCHYGQGFLWSPPVRPDAVIAAYDRPAGALVLQGALGVGRES
jgi:diguanylate cyclase (GGDEF)-like protein